MALHTWLLFALAYLATTLSPGPNILLVIRNTFRHGASGAAISIVGNLAVQGVVVLLVALGVGALLAATPPLFIALKVVGAAYLIYLGIKQLRSRAPAVDNGATANGTERTPRVPMTVASRFGVFRQALAVSGSNPKTMIFLSAFMPQFVAHDHPLAWQFATMYLTMAATVLLIHTLYAYSVTRLHHALKANPFVEKIRRGCGLLFVGLGVKLLLAK